MEYAYKEPEEGDYLLNGGEGAGMETSHFL